MSRQAARKIRRLMMVMFKKALKDQLPETIVLDIDTVVDDNDTAVTREGCSPTYKKVSGRFSKNLIIPGPDWTIDKAILK